MWHRRCCRRRASPGEEEDEQEARPLLGDAATGAEGWSAAITARQSLLDVGGGFDAMVVLYLEAACLAALSAASRGDKERLSEGLVRWCAHQRRVELSRGIVRGDLELPDTEEDVPVKVGTWTLERLHLAEHPPRFPSLYFHFASDVLVHSARPGVLEVVALLRRFPGLVLRVEGFGHPSAPRSLGRAVAQARASATRKALLRHLLEDAGPRAAAFVGEDHGNPWQCDGELDDGVFKPGGYDEGRGSCNVDFYEPRLLGRRLQAVGLWGQDPCLRNSNFAPEAPGAVAWDSEAKFRRVDFTVVRLLDPNSEVGEAELCY
mmetsp:Transcript_106164/g.342878  ORF Transcript_106164/g.342878 Transcript_106164/m.342878 type:complete len:319 (+) Transcript_106164:137-1093(+)